MLPVKRNGIMSVVVVVVFIRNLSRAVEEGSCKGQGRYGNTMS